MPTELHRVLRSQLEPIFKELDQLPMNPLEYRSFLEQMLTAQCLYPIFLQNVKEAFHQRPRLLKALCQLRLISTKSRSALQFLHKHVGEVNVFEFQILIGELFLKKSQDLKVVPRRMDEASSNESDKLMGLFNERPLTPATEAQEVFPAPEEEDKLIVSSQGLRDHLKKLLESFHAEQAQESHLQLQEEIRTHLERCQKADMRDLTGCDFSELDLSQLDLSYMDFSDAIIRHTDFTQAQLFAASFRGTGRVNRHVVNADFSDANCKQVDFSACDLRDSTFNIHTQVDEMSLKSSWLSRLNLEELIPHARWWTAEEGDRPRLNISHVSFEGENLSGMDLSGLYLQKTYFKNTILTGVVFRDSDISGADFKKAKGFSSAQISKCANKSAAQVRESDAQKKRARAAEGSGSITDLFAKAERRAKQARLTQSQQDVHSPASAIQNSQ